jgi:hypothetical protein
MRFVLVAIQILLMAMPLAAEDPLSAFVGINDVQKLRGEGSVSSSVSSDGTLHLLPTMASRDRIVSDAQQKKLTVGVEILRVLTGLPDSPDSPAGLLKIYNAMHAVSTMQGIPYFSTTRGKTHVLFSQSWAVASEKKLDRIPDPVFSDIPAEDVLYTLQSDTSFGRNSYKESFWRDPDHLEVKIENLTTISFFFFPFIDPRNLVSHVALIPAGNDLLFYGLAYLRTSMPIGDRTSREESLANRLTAMADWLKTRLGAGPSQK